MKVLVAGEKDEWWTSLINLVAREVDGLWLDACLSAIFRPAHNLSEHVFQGSWIAVPIAVRVFAEVACKNALWNSASRVNARHAIWKPWFLKLKSPKKSL